MLKHLISAQEKKKRKKERKTLAYQSQYRPATPRVPGPESEDQLNSNTGCALYPNRKPLDVDKTICKDSVKGIKRFKLSSSNRVDRYLSRSGHGPRLHLMRAIATRLGSSGQSQLSKQSLYKSISSINAEC